MKRNIESLTHFEGRVDFLIIGFGFGMQGIFLGGTVVKEHVCNTGDTRDMGLIPWLERSPEGENGNLFQYSCLENSMDRGAWQATKSMGS